MLEYNRSIHIEARPERVSGDAGALLLRQLMDRLGYPELFARHLRDPRDPARVTHPFDELLRTAVLLLAQVSITGDAMLERYRQRGTAEKDLGDWSQALDVALSSAPRPKAHYRAREVNAPYDEPDSFAAAGPDLPRCDDARSGRTRRLQAAQDGHGPA